MMKSNDMTFLRLAEKIGSDHGTCNRGRMGVIIVKHDKVLVQGYVDAPLGSPNCDQVGHDLNIVETNGVKKEHCLRTTHAEINAIGEAARKGISIEGATLYGKFESCANCAKAIIASGIVRVVFLKRYQAAEKSRELFTAAKIECLVLSNDLESY